MKRELLIFATLFAALCGVSAQESFSRRIDISKDYSVDVRSAQKLAVPVSRIDTVVERPSLSYSIVPTAWESNFTPRKIAPARISIADWTRRTPFYLRLGGGFPLQSMADLYWTPVRNRNTTVGLYLNHQGVESTLANDNGRRVSALQLRSRAGAYVSRTLTSLTNYSASVEYSNGIYDLYGGIYDTSVPSLQPKISRVYNNFYRFGGNLNGRFSASSRLAYTADVTAGYATHDLTESTFGHAAVGRYGVRFALYDIALADRRFWIPHSVEVENTGIFPAASYDEPTQITAMVAPRWSWRSVRYMNVTLSAGYYYDSRWSKNNFVADADASYGRYAAFVPYVSIGRRPVRISADDAWAEVPFSMTFCRSSMVNSVKGGFKGRIGKFGYDIVGGGEHYEQYIYYSAWYGFTGLFPMGQKLVIWYASLGATTEILPAFDASLRFRLNMPQYMVPVNAPMHVQHAVGIPAFNAEASIGWRPASNLAFRAEGIVRGATDYTLIEGDPFVTPSSSVVRRPTTVNIRFTSEYSAAPNVKVYLTGDNLLDQRLYDYYSYPLLGINFNCGVKIAF